MFDLKQKIGIASQFVLLKASNKSVKLSFSKQFKVPEDMKTKYYGKAFLRLFSRFMKIGSVRTNDAKQYNKRPIKIDQELIDLIKFLFTQQPTMTLWQPNDIEQLKIVVKNCLRNIAHDLLIDIANNVRKRARAFFEKGGDHFEGQKLYDSEIVEQ